MSKKDEVEELKEIIQAKNQAIAELESKIVNFESEKLHDGENAQKLYDLFKAGIIDSDGNPLMSDRMHSEEEKEYQ